MNLKPFKYKPPKSGMLFWSGKRDSNPRPGLMFSTELILQQYFNQGCGSSTPQQTLIIPEVSSSETGKLHIYGVWLTRSLPTYRLQYIAASVCTSTSPTASAQAPLIPPTPRNIVGFVSRFTSLSKDCFIYSAYS